MFNEDECTDAVIMIREIGGNDEYIAAKWAKEYEKPIVGSLLECLPQGKRMGHAGALINKNSEKAMRSWKQWSRLALL